MPPFDTEVGSFEWTPEGRQLLKELQIRIDVYGGREKLARDIEKENNRHVDKHWQPHEIRALLNNKWDLTIASEKTGRSHGACRHKLKSLRHHATVKKRII